MLCTVLIVDDSSSTRSIVRAIVRDAGVRDDRIFEILFVKSTKFPPRSRAFWAADSYSA